LINNGENIKKADCLTGKYIGPEHVLLFQILEV